MAAMLETSSNAAAEAHEGQDHAVLVSRQEWQRLQADVKFKQTKIEALIFEIARLKRWRFGSSSESLDGIGAQAVLFDQIVADTRAEDAAALAASAAVPSPATPVSVEPRRPVRQALPESLPRIEHHHELESTVCACGQPLKRIGQDVSEQLDCVPAQFFVLRHIRGKYACACCQTIQAAPLPAQIIDKGIPAPGLLALQAASGQRPDPSFGADRPQHDLPPHSAQVVIAKHDDHLPLYLPN